VSVLQEDNISIMPKAESVKVPAKVVDLITQYSAEGKSIRWISEQTGYTRFIVKRVISDNPLNINEKRRDLSDRLLHVVGLCLDNITLKDIQDATLLQRATTMGICLDKLKVLHSQPQGPTNIIEQVNIIQAERGKLIQLLESVKDIVDI